MKTREIFKYTSPKLEKFIEKSIHIHKHYPIYLEFKALPKLYEQKSKIDKKMFCR